VNDRLKENLNILALDTACGDISASIIKHGQTFVLQADAQADGKTRSISIVPALESLLQQAELDWHQLDALALGAGPGSFTGLRIAAATLAGINSGLKLPIIHISSLALTARQADTDEPVWVLEDARAGEAFVACYQRGRILHENVCLNWSDVKTLEPGYFCCHAEPGNFEPKMVLDGWTRLPLVLPRSAALAAETENVTNLTNLPVYPAPVYLQLPQAERNAHA